MLNINITSTKDIESEVDTQLNTIASNQDLIGLNETQKQERSKEFFGAFNQFLTDQVLRSFEELDELRQDARDVQKEIVYYKELMGEGGATGPLVDNSKPLLETLKELREERTSVEQKYSDSLAHVQKIYNQLRTFEISLGSLVNTGLISDKDIDVSFTAINTLEEEMKRCQKEYDNRKQRVLQMAKEFCTLVAILGIECVTEKDKQIETLYHRDMSQQHTVDLYQQLTNDENTDFINKRIAQFEEIKQQREFRKEEISHQLRQLWQRLHIEQQVIEDFLMKNRGLTFDDMTKYEEELDRLLKLKLERVGDFIIGAREELSVLWDQLYFTEEQKKEFSPAYSDILTDTILEAHETEISRLQLECEEQKYILERVEKYMRLRTEVSEFEASTKDPNRLFSSKGNQRDPGRLLREEKFRKRISRELPKTTKELEGALAEFESIKGRPFFVYGQPYLQVIKNNKESSSQEDKNTSMTVNTPKTPKREPIARKPLTSPRCKPRMPRMAFRTPQTDRFRSVQYNAIATPNDPSDSILHSIRERNIKKHQQKKKKYTKKNIFQDEDSDENMAPVGTSSGSSSQNKNKKKNTQQRTRKTKRAASPLTSDNEVLDLGIFDDGPDLSDMSDLEA